MTCWNFEVTRKLQTQMPPGMLKNPPPSWHEGGGGGGHCVHGKVDARARAHTHNTHPPGLLCPWAHLVTRTPCSTSAGGQLLPRVKQTQAPRERVSEGKGREWTGHGVRCGGACAVCGAGAGGWASGRWAACPTPPRSRPAPAGCARTDGAPQPRHRTRPRTAGIDWRRWCWD